MRSTIAALFLAAAAVVAVPAGPLEARQEAIPPAGNSSAPAPPPLDCTARSFDAVPAIVKEKKCKEITLQDIKIPAKQILDLKKLRGGVTVIFAGTTSIEHYDLVKSDESKSPISIGGNNITVRGAPGSLIDGNGAKWWDGFGSNNPDCGKQSKGQSAARCGGKKDAKIRRISKPNYLISLSKLKGTSIVKDLVIKNYPVHGIRITSSQGLTVQNLTLDVRDGFAPNNLSAPLSAAHNTDGLGVSSSQDITIRDSQVFNQDDCVAITSGTNVEVARMLCVGGHGLSIGSVGGKAENTVKNINIHDSKVVNQTNGLRIKTNAEESGLVQNVTFANIQIENALDYGIVIQQDYLNGGPTCEATDGVKIDGVTVKNVTGTVSGEKPKAMGIYVLCGKGTCSNFTFEDVKIEGGKRDSCNDKASGMKIKGSFQCPDTGPNCKNAKNIDEQP